MCLINKIIAQSDCATHHLISGIKPQSKVRQFQAQASELCHSIFSKFSSFMNKKTSLSNKIEEIAQESSQRKVSAEKRGSTSIVPNKVIDQPEILADDWGKISLKVNGASKTFKDVMILPTDPSKGQIAEEWNWAWDDDSMRHRPGIRIKDVAHLIFSAPTKPDVIILTQGRGHGGRRENPGPGILEIMPDVEGYIKAQGVSEVYMLKTAAAIEKYNELRQQKDKHIAALIHTTC